MSTELFRKHYDEGIAAISRAEPDFVLAERSFRRAGQHAPERWEPLYGRAWCLLRQIDGNDGYPPKLQALLEQIVEIAGPACPDALAQLALVYCQKGDFERAVDLGLRAVGRASRFPIDAEGDVAYTWFEDVLVEGMCSLLDRLDEDPATEAALATCRRLEAGVRGAGMPSPIERSILTEVLATTLLVLQRLGDRPIELNDARQALMALSPEHVALQEPSVSSPSVPRTASAVPTFDSVGGLDELGSFQQEIKMLFDDFFCGGDLFEARRRALALGDQMLRMVLMFGPSGCGKTFIVRALAGEYRKRYGRELPLHEVRLNEVFNKWVGDSEKAMTAIFDRAIKTQPCVMFIDEVDAIGGSRDSAQTWRSVQTSHLLQEFDRLRRQDVMVLVLGATNRLWEMELALLRRFDRRLPVDLPNRNVRQQILRIEVEQIAEPWRPQNIDYGLLADRSHGLTPGDLSSVMRRAKDKMRGGRGGIRRLEQRDIEDALSLLGRPIHIRTWVRTAVDHLRKADLADDAQKVLDRYSGYLDEPLTETADERSGHAPIVALTPDMWRDSPPFDSHLIGFLRRIWR